MKISIWNLYVMMVPVLMGSLMMGETNNEVEQNGT